MVEALLPRAYAGGRGPGIGRNGPSSMAKWPSLDSIDGRAVSRRYMSGANQRWVLVPSPGLRPGALLELPLESICVPSLATLPVILLTYIVAAADALLFCGQSQHRRSGSCSKPGNVAGAAATVIAASSRGARCARAPFVPCAQWPQLVLWRAGACASPPAKAVEFRRGPAPSRFQE